MTGHGPGPLAVHGAPVRTVGDLRAALDGYPDDMVIVMSGDAEGNRYSPADHIRERMWIPDGSMGDTGPTPEQGCDGDECCQCHSPHCDLPPCTAECFPGERVLVMEPLN